LNIEVEKNLESGLKKIRGEANQLEQVFLNLITNARDAIVSNSTKGMGNSEFDGKLEIVTRVAGNGYQISEDSITNSGLRIPDLEKDQATSCEQRITINYQQGTLKY
jgi:signal transduction histidine kinase